MIDTPKVLRIETGFRSFSLTDDHIWTEVLDYGVYKHVPRGWRKIEEILRLDFVLAYQAMRLAPGYDVLWVMSEKVGIPLALMDVDKPIITICQHLASPRKNTIIKLTGLTKKWAGLGVLSNADWDYLTAYYDVPAARLIECISAPIDKFYPGKPISDGPIISLGVAKRDYQTLITALKQLPDYKTVIYKSSRYGDIYKNGPADGIPNWVYFENPVSNDEIIERYQRARFVVLPLVDTSQYAAGASVALEAAASGKAVIATATKGMSTFVIHGVTGLLVPPGDPTAMRDAIRRLWNDPALANQMGSNGRKHVERRFNPAEVSRRIRDFIQAIYQKNPFDRRD